MFSSNLIKKGFGFFREIILAAIFGSSIFYSNFLFLKTISELFSEFTQGSAMQAALLSKFSKLYSSNKDVSLKNIFKFSQKVMLVLFVLSQVIQIPIVFYLQTEYFWTFIFVSILLGIILSVNFYNAIFLVIMQGKGQFRKHSISTTIDIFLSTLVLYPLSIIFGIIGIALSRLVGLFSLFYFYLFPMMKENTGEKIQFGVKDFSIPVLFLGNLSNIIILISRFTAGLDNTNNIAFFNYSVVILNVFLTAVILNLNTIILQRISIKKDLRLIFFSVFGALVSGLGLVFVIDEFGFVIFQFIFERGAFTLNDTIATVAYAKDLSYSFILIFIAAVLFQPFFTLPSSDVSKFSMKFASFFIVAIITILIYFYYNSSDTKTNSLVMMYCLSSVYFIISIFSFFKYYKFVR
jgi:peptidoglycan biosynthesis protein MviN/MurJ (putative lipid II flippase)